MNRKYRIIISNNSISIKPGLHLNEDLNSAGNGLCINSKHKFLIKIINDSQCQLSVINYYKDGNVGMRYHSDATYDEWEEDTVVVSFGTNRKLAFREIANYENKTYFEVSSGDMIFMKEGCQQIYQHRVLKDKTISQDRISLVYKKHK